jgi:hypothetical protein
LTTRPNKKIETTAPTPRTIIPAISQLLIGTLSLKQRFYRIRLTAALWKGSGCETVSGTYIADVTLCSSHATGTRCDQHKPAHISTRIKLSRVILTNQTSLVVIYDWWYFVQANTAGARRERSHRSPAAVSRACRKGPLQPRAFFLCDNRLRTQYPESGVWQLVHLFSFQSSPPPGCSNSSPPILLTSSVCFSDGP